MSEHDEALREQDIDDDPLRQFAAWLGDARKVGVREPEAAALATASSAGAPSVRMVLVKTFSEDGFVFFSNYSSRKARELKANPHAALLFHWDPLGRQVRVEGPVQRTSAEETAAYVHSRPRASQLSALASPQSHTLANRAELERGILDLERRYADRDLPIPGDWGGFRMAVETVELWQQRHDRLHDRIRYRRAGWSWAIERLAP